MADFPSGTYSPRTKENRSGVVYDPNKKTVVFVEDIAKLDAEVVALERNIRLPTSLPDELVAGTMIFAVATRKIWIYDGANWSTYSPD